MEEAEEEGDPIRRPAVSTNLDSWDLTDTETPTRQHTPADMKPPNTYTAEDCQVWTQLEKVHLTLKRLIMAVSSMPSQAGMDLLFISN